MRYLLLILGFAVGLSSRLPAQKAPPADTLFRPDVAREIVNYIVARNEIMTGSHNESRETWKRLRKGQYPDTNLVSKWGALEDIEWSESWCQYRRLTKHEQREVFTLRLRNFPELRRYASTMLKRNISKVGFGFDLPGEIVNDYYQTKKGVKIAESLFASTLRKYHVTMC